MEQNQPKRAKLRCCVPNCISHKKNSDEVVHHLFPVHEDIKKKWLKSLKISNKLPKKSLVCSYHFQESDYHKRAKGDSRSRQTLKRTAIPSPFCHENPAKKIIRKSEPLAQEQTMLHLSFCPNQPVDLLAPAGEPFPESSKNLVQTADKISNVKSTNKLHVYKKSPDRCGLNIIKTEDVLSDSDISASGENKKDFLTSDVPHNSLLDTLKSNSKTLPSFAVKVKSEQSSSKYFFVNKHIQRMQTQKEKLTSLLRSEEDLFAYTGINFELMTDLEEAVDFFENKKLHRRLTDSRCRIILCLTRLKLHLAYLRLGPMVGLVSPTHCTEIFRYMITLLSKILSKLIFWPPREESFQKLPACSETPKKISIAFKFIEIPVEDPICPYCRYRLRSSNFPKFSVKVLIGIAPTGLIIYISETFGGQASYSEILQRSNVLSRLDPSQDVVMTSNATKEIETEFLIKNIRVVRSSQLDVYNMKPDKEGPNASDIINARARVECTLELFKAYSILKGKIKVALIPYVEEILTVIGALINLQISRRALKEVRDQE